MKRRRQLTDLAALAGIDAVGEVVRVRHAFGSSRQLAHGYERGARDEQAERGGERDAADDDEREQELEVRERAVDVGERQRELKHAVGGDALGEHPHMRPRHRCVAEERLVLARRDRTRGGGYREPRPGGGAARANQLPVGAQKLREAGRPARLLGGQDQLQLLRACLDGTEETGRGQAPVGDRLFQHAELRIGRALRLRGRRVGALSTRAENRFGQPEGPVGGRRRTAGRCAGSATLLLRQLPLAFELA